MGTYNTGIPGISFRVDCSNSITGTYPDVKHEVSYIIYLQHAYSANSTQYNGAILNFGSNSHSVNINVSGTGEWKLASGTLEYTFAKNNRKDSRNIYFSTIFGNISANGSQTESATIALPLIDEASLSSDYKSVSYRAILTSNPNNFYAIRAVLGEDAKVGNNGGWTDLSPNTNYTVSFYVVYKGSQSTLLTDAVTESITTKKPDKPSKGTVAYINLTPFGATFEWRGFSIKDGSTDYIYQWSVENEKWIDANHETSITLDNLKPETTYTFKVRIVDNYGTASDYASVQFTTLADQVKLACNSIMYQDVLLNNSGDEITTKSGENIYVEKSSDAGVLKQAKLWYNDNGVIKKVKKAYYNDKGTIKVHKNYGI
jgi:hypothetical protein